MVEKIRINNLEEFYQLLIDGGVFSKRWSSSAKKLDADITRAGITDMPKFFHEYDLGQPAPKMEKTINEIWMYLDSDNLLKLSGIDAALDDKLKTQIDDNRGPTVARLDKIVKYIRTNNPELKPIIKTDPPYVGAIHFVRGAVFGYPPKSIEFFFKNYQNKAVLAENLKKNFWLKEKYNIDAGFLRLAPGQLSDLTKKLAFAQAQKTISARTSEMNNFIQWQNDRGMYED